KLQGNDNDQKQNHHEKEALKQEFAKRHRPHAQPPGEVNWPSSGREAFGKGAHADGRNGGFSFSIVFLALPGFSAKASGCSWRARSSMAEMMRGAGRFTASLMTASRRSRTACKIFHPGRVASFSTSRDGLPG